ncbi:hypothetical protein Tco_0945612 [Tanacetum coccineum]
MSADVALVPGGDGGGEDRPPPHHVPTGCMGCFANRGKNFWIIQRQPKHNLTEGLREANYLATSTGTLSLKEISVLNKASVRSGLFCVTNITLCLLGDNAATSGLATSEKFHWVVPLYYLMDEGPEGAGKRGDHFKI